MRHASPPPHSLLTRPWFPAWIQRSPGFQRTAIVDTKGARYQIIAARITYTIASARRPREANQGRRRPQAHDPHSDEDCDQQHDRPMSVICHSQSDDAEDTTRAQGSAEKRTQSCAHGCLLVFHAPYPSVRSDTINQRLPLFPHPRPQPRAERVPQNDGKRV